jgi:phosphatidate cytidylyltransferase
VCALVALVEVLLVRCIARCLFASGYWLQVDTLILLYLQFRELVKVRYNTFFNTIQNTIPLFRTTQWLWFAVAIIYTYGDFVEDIITSNQDLHHVLHYAQYWSAVTFLFYSGTFVLTIVAMQPGHIKFQLNQLSWTIVVLCLTVGQLKYIMHNIYNGLYWFALPILLVVINDSMAYVSGMTCGRKFIHHPFISFSPNKTWEGFIGGAIFTVIASWYLSRFMAQFKWLTCPTNEFKLRPSSLDCELDPIFEEAQSIFSPQLFELFPAVFVKLIPGVVEKCSVAGVGLITACISGEPTHTHHHFDLILKNVYPVQIHTLSLAMFASFVAPFGGFLASAIKRAYGIKNFDSIIPGHGGVMDRFDCQLLMGKAIVAKMICALCVCWCVLKFLTTCFLCSTWCLGVLQHIYKDDDCFRFQDGVHVQSFERSRQS